MRIKKIISLTVLLIFTYQNAGFSISPPIVYGSLGDTELKEDVKKKMYATARRLWRYREEDHKFLKKGIATIGKGLAYVEKTYVKTNMYSKLKDVSEKGLRVYRMADGKIKGTPPKIRDIVFHDKRGKGAPKEWKKNPIYGSKDLISALKYYQKNEARIPEDLLEIKEGYFDVDEAGGEIPVGRIYKRPFTKQEKKKMTFSMRKKTKYKYVLIVHTKFVQMWDHIRNKDVLFDYNFSEDFEPRTISLAWGIFYRFAKHELGDLFEDAEIYDQPQEKNLMGKIADNLPFLNLSRFFSKGGGHLVMHSSLGYLEKPNEDELYTNLIGGRYNLVNDAIWLWFLQSYCFYDTTRYDNNELRARLDWVFNSKKAIELGLRDEFPNLWMSLNENRFNKGRKRENRIKRAIDIAAFINYHFFIKHTRLVTVPKLENNKDKFLSDYNYLREVSQGDPLDATGLQRVLIDYTGPAKRKIRGKYWRMKRGPGTSIYDLVKARYNGRKFKQSKPFIDIKHFLVQFRDGKYAKQITPGWRKNTILSEAYEDIHQSVKMGRNLLTFQDGSFIGGVIPGFLKDIYKNVLFDTKDKIEGRTSIVKALRTFLKTETRLPENRIEIEEGYFDVDEDHGELPLVRIETYDSGERTKRGAVINNYKIIVHTKFVQLWNYLIDNDIRIDYRFYDGKERKISVAWGVFYRIAKHVMSDIHTGPDSKFYEDIKTPGHLMDLGDGTFILHENEMMANRTGGRYALVNDAIWIWFLQSFCFYDTTRYDNDMLLKRMQWIFENNVASNLQFDKEFSNLLKEYPEAVHYKDAKRARKFVFEMAQGINYRFFSRRHIKVPGLDELTVEKGMKELYKKRTKNMIRVPVYTSGFEFDNDVENIFPEDEDTYLEEDIEASQALSLEQIQNICESIDLLDKNKVEILVPQKVYTLFKKELRKELDSLERKRKVNIRAYNFSNIETMLAIKDEDVKRIIISETDIDDFMSKLAEKKPELFRNERIFSIGFPEVYENFTDEGKRAFNQSLLVLGLLSAVVEEDDNVFVKDILSEILTKQFKYSEENTQKFIEQIAISEDSATAEEISKRVRYFLDQLPPVELLNSIVGNNDLVEEFLIYA